MQFRQRGRNISIYRIFKGESGKPNRSVVGSIKQPDYEMDDGLLQALSPDEMKEVTDYVERQKRTESLDSEHAAMKFSATLSQVSDWLAKADAEDAAAFAEDIQRPLRKLRKQLAAIAGSKAEAA